MSSSKPERHIAIFASGGGSNAEAIINHFADKTNIHVSLVVTNNDKAYVLERASKHKIKSLTISKESLENTTDLIDILKDNQIDLIVLAGFLLKIPSSLVQAFPNRIINIHPALLPKYGGPGMYGKHVHQSVFDNFEKESGITIHFVNEVYDDGKIIFQTKVILDSSDTPDVIAKKVLELEHKHYAEVVEEILT